MHIGGKEGCKGQKEDETARKVVPWGVDQGGEEEKGKKTLTKRSVTAHIIRWGEEIPITVVGSSPQKSRSKSQRKKERRKKQRGPVLGTGNLTPNK